MGQLKILMVDGHVIVREGIRRLLDQQGFDCDLLEAGSCADAVTFLEQHDDVNWILLDLGLPDKETAEQARAEAEAANQSKSRFRAAASHDLRQPVHALGLFVATAQQPTTDVAGILQPQIKSVALAPILRKLAAEYRPEADERRLKFRVRCPELAIRTDPLLFERMIRNLLANVLRYTKNGGIRLACRMRGAVARVEVWDTGIGIAPEKQAQVFEEFYQIGNPERDRHNGVGLGLAIVKRIAALVAHRVNLTSRLRGLPR